MSFRLIEDHRDTWPVRVMCDVLEVSPAGYYAWRTRRPSARATANVELVAAIRHVHRDSGGRYGSPRVHAVDLPDVFGRPEGVHSEAGC